jgi:hypothetical protein
VPFRLEVEASKKEKVYKRKQLLEAGVQKKFFVTYKLNRLDFITKANLSLKAYCRCGRKYKENISIYKIISCISIFNIPSCYYFIHGIFGN